MVEIAELFDNMLGYKSSILKFLLLRHQHYINHILIKGLNLSTLQYVDKHLQYIIILQLYII